MISAIRRASFARMKKRALRLYPHDTQAKNANHLAVCSCFMCGNPRRYFKNEKTMQERRADIAFAGHDGD